MYPVSDVVHQTCVCVTVRHCHGSTIHTHTQYTLYHAPYTIQTITGYVSCTRLSTCTEDTQSTVLCHHTVCPGHGNYGNDGTGLPLITQPLYIFTYIYMYMYSRVSELTVCVYCQCIMYRQYRCIDGSRLSVCVLCLSNCPHTPAHCLVTEYLSLCLPHSHSLYHCICACLSASPPVYLWQWLYVCSPFLSVSV